MANPGVLKTVKSFVYVMGAMIVVGLGFLAYGVFIYKADEKNPKAENVAAPVPAPAAAFAPVLGGFGSIGLNQPAGSEIADVMAQGALVYITITGGGEPDRLVVVDLTRGRVLGRIGLGDADSLPPRPAR